MYTHAPTCSNKSEKQQNGMLKNNKWQPDILPAISSFFVVFFSFFSQKLFAKSATAESLQKAFAGVPSSVSVLILATAIICAYMQVRHADQRANRDLVVKKARRWLKKEAGAAGVADNFDWDAPASAFVKVN